MWFWTMARIELVWNMPPYLKTAPCTLDAGGSVGITSQISMGIYMGRIIGLDANPARACPIGTELGVPFFSFVFRAPWWSLKHQQSGHRK